MLTFLRYWGIILGVHHRSTFRILLHGHLIKCFAIFLKTIFFWDTLYIVIKVYLPKLFCFILQIKAFSGSMGRCWFCNLWHVSDIHQVLFCRVSQKIICWVFYTMFIIYFNFVHIKKTLQEPYVKLLSFDKRKHETLPFILCYLELFFFKL